MACAASASRALLFSKSSRIEPSTHSKVPCFSSRYYFVPAIDAVINKRFTTLCAEARSERRRKPYVQKQSSRIKHSPSQQSTHHSTRATAPMLERPEVVFSNNHLLVVNKPAGWKSQPGDGGGGGNGRAGLDPKCLLAHLKSQSLGGGSRGDFLVPTHRLDQPCTGVLIFAKNGKAASRVQVAWGKRRVKKRYWVVVEGCGNDDADGLGLLRSRSVRLDGSGGNGRADAYRLSALLQSTGGRRGRNAGGGGRSNRNNAGGSVVAKPIPPNASADEISDGIDGRVCHIEWEHLLQLPAKASSSSRRHLLSVTTDTGAKHQVRALLALAGGAPIAGDLRYGDHRSSNYRGGRVDGPLPDGSVALHARSVFLPTVSLGGMEFLKDEPFVASVPKRWRGFFGIHENDVKELI